MADRNEPKLLQLPDPCLSQVLHCCSDDLCSLFSAARVHSKLHQAVTTLSSMTVQLDSQQRVRGMLMYLAKHGQRVANMDLAGMMLGACWISDLPISLYDLPTTLQLDSLTLTDLNVQLQPACAAAANGRIWQGVVRPGVPLKQLRLHFCRMLDGMEGLAAALTLLPGLQHLSINVNWNSDRKFRFAAEVLTGLQHLTYFELLGRLQETGPECPPLQSLQSLTRLADLRLDLKEPAAVDSSMLAGMQLLSRLEVIGCAQFDPAALAGKKQMQHLELDCSIIAADAAVGASGVSRLLWDLQGMQQLSHLRFGPSVFRDGNPPAAGFSALTASSKLQHLDISNCVLPTGVWQHVFPDGRQLLQVQWLDISWVTHTPDDSNSAAFEGNRVVSCCPNLKYLNILELQYGTEDLTPLQRLSRLQTLYIGTVLGGNEGLEAVCQLTGLRELELKGLDYGEGLMWQLTQLKQLTRLDFRVGEWAGTPTSTVGPHARCRLIHG
jgi:hypothetical protein